MRDALIALLVLSSGCGGPSRDATPPDPPTQAKCEALDTRCRGVVADGTKEQALACLDERNQCWIDFYDDGEHPLELCVAKLRKRCDRELVTHAPYTEGVPPECLEGTYEEQCGG